TLIHFPSTLIHFPSSITHQPSSMKTLWAPWRIEYVRSPEHEGCIFCEKPKKGDDRDMLILYRGEHSFVIMNLYPYNNAHLMFAPYEHQSDPTQLSTDTKMEIMTLLDHAMEIVRKKLRAEGFNFGLNVGKAAGAGIEEHVHYHLVPRWVGDTNFMPVIGHTKTVVEGLKETYDSLKPEFDKISPSDL
ncbi:MAG: HIT domain-containing protein, partial [Candidatus Neomarinimicrobiota bacterium]